MELNGIHPATTGQAAQVRAVLDFAARPISVTAMVWTRWTTAILAASVMLAGPSHAARPNPKKAATSGERVQLTHVRRLVLDPGHGGDNLGALGTSGIREKVLCLDVAVAVAAWLREHSDLEVLLTRDRDVGLELRQRPRLANDWKGDALISIHANAQESGEAHGMEVFFLAADASVDAARQLVEREEGIRAGDGTAQLAWSTPGILADLDLAAAHARAETLALALGDSLRAVRPKARFRGVRQAAFGVLKEARMPAIVFEIGYLTHAVEGPQLTEPEAHVQFAKAILRALQRLDRRMATETETQVAAKAKKH